ncbi:UNVERIFIED_CONTAM: DUF1727 domain-containing protein, partial [Bifidobacterium breve]|nr:DUF1727 domain-containing protein [Bifidobacterium breve]
MKVITNNRGKKYVRGGEYEMITEVNIAGKLEADIDVLELDEEYAGNVVKKVKPRYDLLKNVMREQSDRFGEIDTKENLL